MDVIIGAGLSGLIAAHAFPRAKVVEAMDAPAAGHAALLRFRSSAVADLTGIPFREVTVHKGIHFRGKFRSASIELANLYSRKVLGRLIDRSIWSLRPAQRFVAPENFYDQLVDSVLPRIEWGTKVKSYEEGTVYLNTAPLPVACRIAGIEPQLSFNRAPIVVARFRTEPADVYQTIYFPDPEIPIYRASITGNVLIVEAIKTENPADQLFGLSSVKDAFGDLITQESLGNVEQKYGKIAPVDDNQRRQLIFRLTQEHSVYSLGRFAVWKNILLDDVVADIAVLRKMMRASSYDRARAQFI